MMQLHTPVDPIGDDEEDADVEQPVVPPDQDADIVPQRDPPNPGQQPMRVSARTSRGM